MSAEGWVPGTIIANYELDRLKRYERLYEELKAAVSDLLSALEMTRSAKEAVRKAMEE